MQKEPYGNIGFIKEFKYSTTSGTGCHVPISLKSPTEIRYVEFIDHNGNVYSEARKAAKLTDKYTYEGAGLDKGYESVRTVYQIFRAT